MPATASGPSSLAALARALGGEWYAGGRRALAPAPGHGPADRSVSLRLEAGRVLVHSFGRADWREVLDALRADGWIDAQNRLLRGGDASLADPSPDRSVAERVRAAQALWAAAQPISSEGPAGVYCQGRGFAGPQVGALRQSSAVPQAVYRGRGPFRPALLAPIAAADGELTAVEITYLDATGRRSRTARPSRKVIGAIPAGAAVQLAAPACGRLLVAEGVFTTLAAAARFGLPGWALLSTSNLRRWRAPEGVRTVLIAGDRGPDGERSAGLLCAHLRRAGVAADVVLPPVGAGDWNDLALKEEEEGRRGAPGPQGLSRAAGRSSPHACDRFPS
ncbi:MULTISPECIES: toprim domain-containing protein [unclassified Phenylobacterium]|uniref:toprim domain-containing protein n=1 Tax=unclassified Phenylobacterium TaxID=2640670 RepID=UPI0009E7B3AF|nr:MULTISPECIES: toprim domain-containing protein [unclassified Phenylobacterium]